MPSEIVTSPVKAGSGHASEVAYAGERGIDKPFHELIHAAASQSDHDANLHTVSDLEACYGLSGPGNHRLLTGDGGQHLRYGVNSIGVGQRLSQTHVHHDFLHARRLQRDLVAKLADELRHKLLPVLKQKGRARGWKQAESRFLGRSATWLGFHAGKRPNSSGLGWILISVASLLLP